MNFNPRDALTSIKIGGKPVVMFEKHQFALLPWHDWRSQLPSPPRLLSLDTHTDSMIAFRGYACSAAQGKMNCTVSALEARERRLSCLVRTDPASVEDAVQDLRHDEHIDAALHAGILDVAFIVSRECNDYIVSNDRTALNEEAGAYVEPREKAEEVEEEMPGGRVTIKLRPEIAAPPFSYSIPKNRIVILEDVGSWIDDNDDDDARRRNWRDNLLDSFFLEGRLALIDRISASGGIPSLFERPFILDIDLDAFNTRRAMAPTDTAVFYDLVRRAVGVTIAREPGYVADCRLQGEDLTADWLEEALLAHLEKAIEG